MDFPVKSSDRYMNLDITAEHTKDKYKQIEMILKCIRDLNLFDDFLMRPGRGEIYLLVPWLFKSIPIDFTYFSGGSISTDLSL